MAALYVLGGMLRTSELIFIHKIEDKNGAAAVKGIYGRVSHSITRPFPDFSHDAQAKAQWAADELGSIDGEELTDTLLFEVHRQAVLRRAQQHREQGLGLLVRSQHNRSLEGE